MDRATFERKWKDLQSSETPEHNKWKKFLNEWLYGGKKPTEIQVEVSGQLQVNRYAANRLAGQILKYFGIQVANKQDRANEAEKQTLINLFNRHYPDFLHESIRGKDFIGEEQSLPLPVPETKVDLIKVESRRKLTNLQSIQARDSAEFFGRDQILREIHTKLQEQPRLALVGMGGVGKTEAAVQYATSDYAEDYSGGTWWLSVPQGNIGGQVLSITIQRFQNFQADVHRNLPPTDLAQQCWQEWYGKGRALVVLDDVDNIGEVQNFLPKQQNAELVVLLTSRESLVDLPVLRLDVLGPIPALQLLFSAMGKPVPKGETLEECLAEVTPEERQAPALCKQVGCLPLALELIGKYLKQLEQDEEPLSIPQLILQLEGKGLNHGALQPDNYLMNGQRGVAAALELSWARLRDSAQRLAELLAPYQVGATIPHGLLEAHTQRYLQLRGQDYDSVALQDDTRDLRNRSLLKGNARDGFSIHPLVHRFFKDKLEGKL